MMTRLTRLAATGVAAAALSFGSLAAIGAYAKGPDALTIDPGTLQATAPADFIAGEEVALWYNLPDGSAVAFETTTALADGSLDWSISPADWNAVPSNAVNLVAQGWQSDTDAIYTFNHSAPMASTLSIDTQTLVATAPADFIPGEEVGLWYNLPDGTAVTFETTYAMPDGTLNWTISQTDWNAIPSNAVNLVAQGLQSDHQAIYTFSH